MTVTFFEASGGEAIDVYFEGGGLSKQEIPAANLFHVGDDPVNQAPTATGDSASTLEDTAVTIDVLANDSDPDLGDVLTVDSVTQGASGSVTHNGSDVTYTPNAGFTGTDTFDYTVSDGKGLYDTATVTVTVEEAPPVGDIIGINLLNVNTNTEVNYGGVVMDASDTAGVEAQNYWNNLDEDSTNSLVENDGSGGYQPTASQQYMDSEGNLTNLSVVWNTAARRAPPTATR
ncbi:MAG: hypothetical protein GVY16_06695 [Planctomycetes bacterium]|jgi:hypothetical protein|nr:hypothetical protein [Planctomycetota bacterium]